MFECIESLVILDTDSYRDDELDRKLENLQKCIFATENCEKISNKIKNYLPIKTFGRRLLIFLKFRTFWDPFQQQLPSTTLFTLPGTIRNRCKSENFLEFEKSEIKNKKFSQIFDIKLKFDRCPSVHVWKSSKF